jgi:hypothetical protein
MSHIGIFTVAVNFGDVQPCPGAIQAHLERMKTGANLIFNQVETVELRIEEQPEYKDYCVTGTVLVEIKLINSISCEEENGCTTEEEANDYFVDRVESCLHIEGDQNFTVDSFSIRETFNIKVEEEKY